MCKKESCINSIVHLLVVRVYAFLPLSQYHMTRKGASVIFKTSFDTPIGQWTRLRDEEQARELLKRTIAELARYAPALARRASKERRPKSGSSSEREKGSCPILIGLNACTRALERTASVRTTKAKNQGSMKASKELVAVLVCKDDVTHARIFQHLPFLGRLCRLPVLPLPKGSAGELGTLFGLPNCAVIGILRDSSSGADSHWELDDFVTYLVGMSGENMAADISQYQGLMVTRTMINKSTSKTKTMRRERSGLGERDTKRPKIGSTT